MFGLFNFFITTESFLKSQTWMHRWATSQTSGPAKALSLSADLPAVAQEVVGEFRGCRRYPALPELPTLPGGAEGTSPGRPAGFHSQNLLTAPELRLPAASYRPPSLRLGFRRPLPHPVPGRSSSEPFPVKTPPRPVTGPRTRTALQAACRPLTGRRSHLPPQLAHCRPRHPFQGRPGPLAPPRTGSGDCRPAPRQPGPVTLLVPAPPARGPPPCLPRAALTELPGMWGPARSRSRAAATAAASGNRGRGLSWTARPRGGACRRGGAGPALEWRGRGAGRGCGAGPAEREERGLPWNCEGAGRGETEGGAGPAQEWRSRGEGQGRPSGGAGQGGGARRGRPENYKAGGGQSPARGVGEGTEAGTWSGHYGWGGGWGRGARG